MGRARFALGQGAWRDPRLRFRLWGEARQPSAQRCGVRSPVWEGYCGHCSFTIIAGEDHDPSGKIRHPAVCLSGLPEWLRQFSLGHFLEYGHQYRRRRTPRRAGGGGHRQPDGQPLGRRGHRRRHRRRGGSCPGPSWPAQRSLSTLLPARLHLLSQYACACLSGGLHLRPQCPVRLTRS